MGFEPATNRLIRCSPSRIVGSRGSPGSLSAELTLSFPRVVPSANAEPAAPERQDRNSLLPSRLDLPDCDFMLSPLKSATCGYPGTPGPL